MTDPGFEAAIGPDSMLVALLKADLVRDEGNRLVVYDDATGKPLKQGDTLRGNPTIGTGRCLSTLGISERERDFLLENDIDRVLGEMDRALPWWRGLAPARKRGLLNMAFNLGLPRLLKFQAMLAALKAGNFQIAGAEALDSAWARQVGERSERIAKLIREG